MREYFTPSNHHRNFHFRPPRKDDDRSGTDWPLYLRFIKAYVWPKRISLLLCLLLLSVNSGYVYVITFYSKLVVDTILVIAPEPKKPGDTSRSIFGNLDEKPTHAASGGRRTSMGRKMDMGVRLSKRPPEAGRKLFLMAVIYMISQLFFNTLARLTTRQQIIVSQNITAKLREDMHRKVLDLSMSYHQAMSPGRLLSRIISDVQAVQAEMMALFMSATHSITLIVVGFLILLCTVPSMALVVLAITPIYAWMFKAKRPLIRSLNQEVRHTNSCMYGLVTQKLDGMKVIQAYAREAEELLHFHRLSACFMRDSLDTLKVSSTLNRKAGLLAHFTSMAIYLYGGKRVLDGSLTLGQMILMHTTCMTLFQPVLEFTQLTFVLQRLRVALVRIANVLDKPLEIVDSPNALPFPSPIRKGLEIRNLSFAYPQTQSDKEAESDRPAVTHLKQPEPVLRDINLTVPAGTWLCIMGASGAGKTTLLNLLSRLYVPTFGKILIDGIDLQTIKMLSLRHAVGIVPQEAQIFYGTMRDNICYGLPDASNTQIMDAAKAAQLHDFIMDMKVKYETLIGQKGTSLSGGQRQRLSLARALLTNPELLILDDCTSALDAATEQKIQETLATVLQGKTAIMVSQRVSMAMRCHQIAVLENGVISECGTHHELLSKHGFYAKLYSQQTE